MFYSYFKNLFNKIDPLKRLFVQNIVLALIFCLLSIATLNLKLGVVLNGFILFLTLMSVVINLLFIYVILKTKRVHLFYLLVAIGGFSILLVLFISAIEMIGWDKDSLIAFCGLFIVSDVVLIYIHYKALRDDFMQQNIRLKKSKYTWNVTLDIYADTNKKYGNLINLVRTIIAPFAPAVGIAISRNLGGQQEWLVQGFLMLSLALILNAGYLKYLVMGFKFWSWQKMLSSEIEITDV
jgi:hypothetical protein